MIRLILQFIFRKLITRFHFIRNWIFAWFVPPKPIKNHVINLEDSIAQAKKIVELTQSNDWADWLELLNELKTIRKYLFNHLPHILHLVIEAKAKHKNDQENPIKKLTNDVLDLLFEYVKKGWIDVNQRDIEFPHATALHIAIGSDVEDYEVFQKLIQLNADINAPDIENATSLHLAACKSETKFLIALLETGKANVNVNTINQQTPLHCACLKQRHDNLALLLKYGAKISVNVLGSSPIMMLEPPETNPSVDLLWEAEKKFIDNAGNTLLHRLCRVDFAWFTQKLLSEPDCHLHIIDNKKNQTPLHVAAANAAINCIKCLVKEPSTDLNAIDIFGFTALAYAIRENDFISIQEILTAGANVNIKIKNRTHMHFAVLHTQAITILYKRNNELIHDIDDNNQIPFQHALALDKKKSIDILILLHKKCESINRRYALGQTLLHMAASFGNKEIVAELIKLGAQILQDENGNTPLHIAVMNGHVKCCRIFLQLKTQATFLYLANNDGKIASALIEQNQKLIDLFNDLDHNIVREKNAAYVRSRLLEEANKHRHEKPTDKSKSNVVAIDSKGKVKLANTSKRDNKSKSISPVEIMSSLSWYKKPTGINYKQKIKWKNLLFQYRQTTSWLPGQKIIPDMLVNIFWDDWLGDNSELKLTSAKLLHPNLITITNYFKKILHSSNKPDFENFQYISTKIVGTTTVNILLSNFGKHAITTGDTDVLLSGISMNNFLNYLNQIDKEAIWWSRSNYYTYQIPGGRFGEALKLSVKNEKLLDISCIDLFQFFENLEHRDFTILGITLDLIYHTIVCPREWLEDLLMGIIRCIDDPIKSFNDDFSRKIRGLLLFILLEKFNFKFDHQTELALKTKLKDTFDNIELKSTLYQLEKLFQKIGCNRFFQLLQEFNLFSQMTASLNQIDYLFKDNVFIFANKNKDPETIKTLEELRQSARINGWKQTAETYLSTHLSEILILETALTSEQNKELYRNKIHLVCTLLITGVQIDYSLISTPYTTKSLNA